MNVVMTGSGQFVEVQGTGEEATFSEDDLATMLKLAKTAGIRECSSIGPAWPLRSVLQATRPVQRGLPIFVVLGENGLPFSRRLNSSS